MLLKNDIKMLELLCLTEMKIIKEYLTTKCAGYLCRHNRIMLTQNYRKICRVVTGSLATSNSNLRFWDPDWQSRLCIICVLEREWRNLRGQLLAETFLSLLSVCFIFKRKRDMEKYGRKRNCHFKNWQSRCANDRSENGHGKMAYFRHKSLIAIQSFSEVIKEKNGGMPLST